MEPNLARTKEQIRKLREEFIRKFKGCVENCSEFSEHFLNHKLYPYQIPYADSKKRYLVFRSGRQVGKTMTTAAKAIHFAFFAPLLLDTVKNECTILIVAPTQDQARIMYDRIRTLIMNSETVADFVVRNTQTEMWVRWMNDGGITKIITRATGETGSSVRGYSPHVIIVDECAFIKEDILRALFPAGAATRARVWMTSTPFSKSGYFYKACMDSNTLNGTIIKPDAQWTQFHVKSTENPIIAADTEYLKFIKSLTQEQYALEVEGEFLDIGNALIPFNMIHDALGGFEEYKMQGDTRRFVSCDVARTGFDETVYMVAEVDDQEVARIIHIDREAQSNVVDVAGKCGDLMQRYKGQLLYIDETGLGGGLLDMCKARSIPSRGQMFSLKEKERMFKDLRVVFENHRIKFDNQTLAEQLSTMTREYTETGIMKVKSEGLDDHVDALALVCQAIYSGDEWHVLDMSKEAQKAIFG